MTIVQILFQLK